MFGTTRSGKIDAKPQGDTIAGTAALASAPNSKDGRATQEIHGLKAKMRSLLTEQAQRSRQ
jgi:hypothetical protein